jgi:hypothetical protein
MPRKSGKRRIHDASTIAHAICERQVLKREVKEGSVEYPKEHSSREAQGTGIRSIRLELNPAFKSSTPLRPIPRPGSVCLIQIGESIGSWWCEKSYEAGIQPADGFAAGYPGRWPWAGMIDAVGVEGIHFWYRDGFHLRMAGRGLVLQWIPSIWR